MSISFPQTQQCLEKTGIEYREITDSSGAKALVTSDGARILGLSLPGDDANVLWTNPKLPEISDIIKDRDELLAGPGGIRTWFGPEYAHGWDGKPDDVNYGNYVIQPGQDPGHYLFTRELPGYASIMQEAELRDLRDGSVKKFRFSSETALAAPGQLPEGVRGLALRLSGRMELLACRENHAIDVWRIAQLPAGGRMIFPLAKPSEPLTYFDPHKSQGWEVRPDAVIWPTTGEPTAKIGLAADAVTGTIGALLNLPHAGEKRLYLWNHILAPGLEYVDGPDLERAQNQAVQAWDGFGFCELEYHAPAANAHAPLTVDHSVFRVFQGPAPQIDALCREQLGTI